MPGRNLYIVVKILPLFFGKPASVTSCYFYCWSNTSTLLEIQSNRFNWNTYFGQQPVKEFPASESVALQHQSSSGFRFQGPSFPRSPRIVSALSMHRWPVPFSSCVRLRLCWEGEAERAERYRAPTASGLSWLSFNSVLLTVCSRQLAPRHPRTLLEIQVHRAFSENLL